MLGQRKGQHNIPVRHPGATNRFMGNQPATHVRVTKGPKPLIDTKPMGHHSQFMGGPSAIQEVGLSPCETHRRRAMSYPRAELWATHDRHSCGENYETMRDPWEMSGVSMNRNI